jgi:deazaflavin-dependent oxidoreductase (nitroreductase family)
LLKPTRLYTCMLNVEVNNEVQRGVSVCAGRSSTILSSARLLRSPLHSLISNSTMLITFAGRKSGRTYTTPVKYVWDDHTLLVVSPNNRLWWRNLRTSALVTVCVRGENLKGIGQAFEGEEAVEEGGLLTMLQKAPAYRRYWGIELDAQGQLKDPQEVFRVAWSNALIRIGDLTPT